jgi:hypothetical protein
MRAFPPLKNASFRTALALCITACFCVLLYSIVYAERPISYLCSTEMTTGFRLDESTGKWQVAKFKESKYIISNSDASGWYVRLLGSADAIARCQSMPEPSATTLRCSGSEEFWIDTKRLKFTAAHPHGYLEGQGVLPEGHSTPFISIGRCSLL